MTIIEAIKSGKPFKRANEYTWTTIQGDTILLEIDDLLADDWEIKS